MFRLDSMAVVNCFSVGAYRPGCCRLSFTPLTRSSCGCDPFNHRISGASSFSSAEIRSLTSGVSGIKRISDSKLLVIQGGAGSGLHDASNTRATKPIGERAGIGMITS